MKLVRMQWEEDEELFDDEVEIGQWFDRWVQPVATAIDAWKRLIKANGAFINSPGFSSKLKKQRFWNVLNGASDYDA
jgi:hypothetical protein